MKAVILAGGLGRRLEPFTRVIPKPLLPVGNRSVLEIQILHLRDSGVREIYLALGYRHELFEAYCGDGSKWGVRLRYSVEPRPLGTAGPLTLLRDHLDEPFLVINGDILTDADLGEIHAAHLARGAAATVATKVITVPLQYGVVRHLDERILAIEEKPSLRAEINAGIYCLDPEVVGLMPPASPVSMDDLLGQLIAARRPVYRFPLASHWLDIGQMDDYEKANDLAARDGSLGAAV
jgi:mannose-1-phosphate guanylyltransferase